MSSAETARVTTFVAVPPHEAFAVFTEEIDRWWRRGPRFRALHGEAGALSFERDARGRRLVERAGGELFEIGRVLVWEPGRRLVFEWRASNFAPGDVTEVEVRFELAGEGTRVTLEHRGWDAIRGDHPVRHGQHGRELGARLGAHWAQLMGAYRLFASARSS